MRPDEEPTRLPALPVPIVGAAPGEDKSAARIELMGQAASGGGAGLKGLRGAKSPGLTKQAI